MRARVLLDHEAVATGVGHTVHAMVEVAAAAPVVDRPPVTLMVAMDTSGSMAGDRIDTALECVRQLVRQLGPRDRLGLVTFGTEARVRFSPTVADELDLDAELGRIIASGSTNLSAGWLLALDTATSAGGQLHRGHRVERWLCQLWDNRSRAAGPDWAVRVRTRCVDINHWSW